MIKRIDFKQEKYSTLSNEVLFNTNLTPEAKIFLMACINNHKNYIINANVIAGKLGFGTDRTKSILKSLEKYGFMRRKRVNMDNGCFRWEYTFSELGDLIDEAVNGESVQPQEAKEETPTQPEVTSTQELEPMEEVMIKFDLMVDGMNIDGLPSAQRKIKERVREMFIKDFKPFESDEAMATQIYHFYERVSPMIIESEASKMQPKTVVRCDW